MQIRQYCVACILLEQVDDVVIYRHFAFTWTHEIYSPDILKLKGI